MNLREEILIEHSKSQALKIEKWVGKNQSRFDELVSLFLMGEYRVTQRAGWPLSNIVIRHPELVQKHLKKILVNIDKSGHHPAVVRNTFRLLQFIEIPKPLQGLAADTCFRFFTDRNQPIAIRVFSMTVLGNLCKVYPELAGELKLAISDQLPYASAGFKARAKKVLRQLDQNLLTHKDT